MGGQELLEGVRRETATRREAILLASVVGAAILLAFADFLSVDRIPAYRDLLVFVVPFKRFLATHWQRGELPLWNPWLYMGTPFLASLQSGVFYPPSVLFLLPFALAFNVFVLAHFAIAAIGMWYLARDLGLSSAACAVGASSVSLGGYFVSLVSLTSHLQAAAWIPWLLLFWARHARERRLADLMRFIGTFTLFVLAGAPEITLMAAVVLAGWTVLAAGGSGQTRLRLCAVLGIALLAAAGLAAFQLVPTVEYIGQSDRRAALPFEEVAAWSLQPISLVQLLLPYSAATGTSGPLLEAVHPWLRSIYFGLVPLCLAIAGVTALREARFWGLVAVAGILLALGDRTPVLRGLYAVAPFVFGRFRYPEKFYCVVHVAVAILAAIGAERCLRGERFGRDVARTAAATLLTVAASIAALRWGRPATFLQIVAAMSGTPGPMTAYVGLAEGLGSQALRASLVLACFLAVLRLHAAALLSTGTLGAVLALLAAGDLATAAHGLNLSVSWDRVATQAPMLDVDSLRAARQRVFLYQQVSAPFPGVAPRPIPGLEHRISFTQSAPTFDAAAAALWGSLLLDIPMAAEVGTLSGDDGIMRRSDGALRAALSSASTSASLKLLRTFGVAALAGPIPLDDPALQSGHRAGDPPTFVYALRDPLPPAYLAARLSVATGELALSRILDPSFEPGVDAVLEELPDGWTDGAPLGGAKVAVVEWRDTSIRLTAQSEAAALLVVNDSYFPGWAARVDGAPAAIRRANFLARGIALSAGEHRIELRYEPLSLRIGTGISIVTAAGLAAFAVARRRREGSTRRRPPSPSGTPDAPQCASGMRRCSGSDRSAPCPS